MDGKEHKNAQPAGVPEIVLCVLLMSRLHIIEITVMSVVLALFLDGSFLRLTHDLRKEIFFLIGRYCYVFVSYDHLIMS